MAEKYVWDKIAWNDYQKWIKENKAIAKKIIELIFRYINTIFLIF